MFLFNKNKKNSKSEENIISTNNKSIIEMNNYMLSDIRKNSLSTNCYSLSISDISKISPLAIPTVKTIKTITQNNKKSLYMVTNLGTNDSLKAMKDGKTFWGAIKRSNGDSAMAKLKEVNANELMSIDPTVLMMSVALAGIESEIGEIKKVTKNIILFLEEEKEAEIESDLELLNRSIEDFKYNMNDDKFIINNHKQIMDIKRTANKNMLFYKKQLKDSLEKNSFIVANTGLNSIIEDIEKKLKYYRLSLYIYSFSTLLEVLLIGNYQTDYLSSKANELNQLDNEYTNTYNSTLKYVEKNAKKSIEGNVLSGLGDAGKAMGNLAEKMNIKTVDTWLNDKSNSLKQTSKRIRENFTKRLEEIKDSHSREFINQIINISSVYNNTKDIYFDNENIYLEMKEKEI